MLKNIFVIVGLVIVSLNCTPKKIVVTPNPPTPDIILDFIEDSLSSKGFEFNVYFENPNVKSSSKGIYVKGRVKVNGWRKFENAKESIDAIGIDEDEYKKEKGKWIAGTRTYDTQPVELLVIICKEGEIKFSEIKDGFFVYKFTPNLLFIDPSLMEDPKAAEGEIWINAESLMLTKIITKSKNSKWNMELTNFGKKINIFSPVTKSRKLKIYAEKNTEQIAQLLKQRLEIYGIEGEYKLNGSQITLEFYSENDLPEEFIQQGKLELYAAEYPKQSIYETKGVRFILGDSTRPVLLKDKIMSELVSCQLEDGEDNESKVNLEFNKELPETTKIAVVVDSQILELIPQAWGRGFKMKCNKEIAVKVKFPFPYEAIVSKK